MDIRFFCTVATGMLRIFTINDVINTNLSIGGIEHLSYLASLKCVSMDITEQLQVSRLS